MMQRGKVFFRARDETGRYGCADILDLDETSFRAVIVEVLVKINALLSLESDSSKGEEIQLTTRAGFRFPDDD